jgi:hypothetical protein
MLADCSDNSNTVASVLIEDDLDRLLLAHPGCLHLHPHIERRLVGVNDQSLLLDQLGQGDGELLNLFLRLCCSLLVLIGGGVVANLVFQVEHPQRGRQNTYTLVDTELLTPLSQSKAAPTL